MAGVFLLIAGALWLAFKIAEGYQRMSRRIYRRAEAQREEPRPPPTNVAPRLRALDPSFSEPVFLDWANLIFTRFHEARGTGDIDAIAPYLSEFAVKDLARGPESGPVKELHGLVIGSTRLEDVEDGELVLLDVVFRANWTAALKDGRDEAFWLEEQWTFARRKGVSSRAPENVERLGCPACGSATERTSLGRCAHCGNSTRPGDSDWMVQRRRVREIERKPPLLTGTVEEVGTDLPTVKQPNAQRRYLALPEPARQHFDHRSAHIFQVLQTGWSEGDLELMRPLETDALFSQHRFWLEQYQKQGLSNRLQNLRLGGIEICKVDQDAYYDAITCRMRASAIDVTVRPNDARVVAGDPKRTRQWTEYWTYIRRRGAKDVASDVQCPSCTAPLKVTQAGVCAHCTTKLTRGDFDWVLSRIEQDEEYVG